MTSPFKFLDSYTLADRDIFFGRDQEITELYRKVFESKILLVYGISGTGKSSLVNCGLASRFDDSDWLPVNVRRGNNIVVSLNEAINKQAITSLKKSRTFEEKLQSVYLDHFKPIYLVFDQFEELFIFGTQDEKMEFIKIINEAVVSKTQCRIIFVIREEFLAGMTEFEYELPEIFTNRFRVEKMKRANAINAIEGPCKVHNIELEQGFSEELIDKLSPAGNEIELTYLQIYLDRILRIASDQEPAPSTQHPATVKIRFSRELLTKAGSVSDLLGQFLDEQIREFEDPETGMAILKSFVSVQGTKKQMTEQEILDSISTFGKSLSEPDLVKYLTKFVALRILRERDEAGHFELRHDALAAKIYEKFTLLEKELLDIRLFVDNAYQTFKSRKTFLTKDDLNYLSTYEKRLFLPQVLEKFVQESKDKIHSQQRALRRLTTIVGVVFLIIVAAGVQYYLNKKGRADTKELTTLALLQEQADPLTGINTAFKIREKDSVSTVIQGIILRGFYKLLEQKISSGDTLIPADILPRPIPVAGSILSLRLIKDGSQLFGWTDCKEVFTAGVSNKIVGSFKVEDEIEVVEMSPDGRYLAVIFKNGNGEVYDKTGRKIFKFETTVNHLMNNRLVRFFPEGKYFMAAVKNKDALIYDSTGVILFNLAGHTGRINSLDISPDGRFVATASSDKSVLIWNFNYRTRVFSPYDTLIRYKNFTGSYADSIIGHKDTIWSCEFNKTGKFILTASADSMLFVWDLNGRLYNEFFLYAMNSVHGEQYFWPLWNDRSSSYIKTISKSDLTDSYLNGYYKKVYDATFAANEKAIIASNYSYNTGFTGTSDGIFRTRVLYFDGMFEASQGKNSWADPYISLAQSQKRFDPLQNIRFLGTSPDRQIFAAVPFKKEVIQIVANDGYKILNIPGSFIQFSKDGKYLFYISGKNIKSLPLNLKDIYYLVIIKKLFGHPEEGEEIWKVL